MKLIPKTLALILACSAVGLAQAGNIEWRTKNETTTFHTYELDAAIRQGIGSAGNLPDLPNPWFLQFTLYYRVTNQYQATPEYQATPGLILIEKARFTPSGKLEIACRSTNFGTFTKTYFLEVLREKAQLVAGYATTSPECVVNDPEPAAPPAKKSSKK